MSYVIPKLVWSRRPRQEGGGGNSRDGLKRWEPFVGSGKKGRGVRLDERLRAGRKQEELKFNHHVTEKVWTRFLCECDNTQ